MCVKIKMRGGLRPPRIFLHAILFCMKKYLFVILASGLFFNSVYACGFNFYNEAPHRIAFLHYSLLFVSLVVIFFMFFSKKCKEHSYYYIFLIVSIFFVMFEIFVVSGGLVFSQCIDYKNIDFKNVVIPEFDFKSATTTASTTAKR